jgi:hypothetical protein
MLRINKIPSCPLPARRGREEGGQPAPGPIRLRAGAPRQRPGRGESRRLTAGRSTPAWSWTISWDGSPLMKTLLLHSINRSKRMKPSLYILAVEVAVTSITVGPGHTVISPDNHPGVYQRPKPEREVARNPGTLFRRPEWSRTVSAGWERGRRRRSTLRAGKPSTWGRTPARPIQPMQRHGDRGESLGA